MDFIDNRGLNEDLDTQRKEEKSMDYQVKPSKKVNTNPIIVNNQKKLISRKCHTNNSFKPEEDQILLEAIRSGEELDFTKLAKKMNRNSGSVLNRVNKLKFTGVSTTSQKSYTINEDLRIIDLAVKNLQKFSKLDDDLLRDCEDLAVGLRRKTESVRYRWVYQLLVWLKSYYEKTLNLDIRIMLANVVADNFENIDSIDWNFVISFKEFSAYTILSIKSQFFSVILRTARRLNNGEKTDLTLRDIATFASTAYSKENAKKISASILVRQREVIEYFEKKVKELGIKDFL